MPNDDAVDRLRELVRIPTVSRLDPADVDRDAFEAFRDRLARLYPLVHEHLEREVVGGGSLLYRWPGRGDGPPAVLMAHYDVVPVDEQGWTRAPFGGELSGEGDGARVHGRGTIDDKGALVAILEAVESRLAEGYRPDADVYLSFGHDEEVAGDGAPAVVELLASRGVAPALVLDEGGAVVEGVFPGVSDPIAVVGVSEKGIASVELIAERPGGHASTPMRDAAAARLARAILRLERSPAPASLPEPTEEMIRRLGARARGPLRLLFTRAAAFRGLIAAVFSRLGPETNAMVRTTYAVTRLRGSAGDNVIAGRATAIVNVRIAVGSSLDEAVRRIADVVAKEGVAARLVSGSEPSPVSPSTGAAWDALAASIATVYPDAVVTPYVMLQASDARHFTRIGDHVYRFLPFDLTTAERAALHGDDESIRVDAFLRGVEFFRDLVGRV